MLILVSAYLLVIEANEGKSIWHLLVCEIHCDRPALAELTKAW